MIFAPPTSFQDAGCVHAPMEWTLLYVKFPIKAIIKMHIANIIQYNEDTYKTLPAVP
jgi:hypothetical protein